MSPQEKTARLVEVSTRLLAAALSTENAINFVQVKTPEQRQRVASLYTALAHDLIEEAEGLVFDETGVQP